MGNIKNRLKAEKIDLAEGQLWSNKTNSIQIIKCHKVHRIVEVKLSTSPTTKEFPMIQIQRAIMTENLTLSLKHKLVA